MIQTACPVCSGSTASEFVHVPAAPVYCNLLFATADEAKSVPRADIRLAFCPACGMIWNVDFDPALMSYEKDYENSLHGSSTFRDYAERLAARLVETYDIRGKDVIEIGCGRGEFLERLCGIGGNRGLGLDPSSAAQHGPQHPAIRMVQTEYSQVHRDEPVDLLVCRHVLEHVASPSAFLASIREVLDDRLATTVFFEVPDGRSMLERLGVWDLIYEHCSYFTSATLARAFEASGFEVQRVSSEYEAQFLCLEATPDGARRPREGSTAALGEIWRLATRFGSARLDVIDEWNERLSTWRADGRRVALWGAGSKAVTFLNTVPAAAGIDAVIDTNPRKQGAYVSGTGQYILAPSALRDRPPNIVVVLNPAYGKEVNGALRELGLAAEVVVDTVPADPLHRDGATGARENPRESIRPHG